jgi:hypothetical protein
MTFKTKTKNRIKLFLRRLGFLCKQPKKITRTLKISHTLNPDGTITVYNQPIFSLPENTYGIESEIHVFLEEKKLANPGCKFDTNAKTCVCGKTLEEFTIGQCIKNK